MDKKYIELFEHLAQATAASAEHVMDYDHEKGDEKGFETAKTMRDDYQALHDRISEANNDYIPTRNDAAKLLVSAMVIINQLQSQIQSRKKSIDGYQTLLIPTLQKIVDEAKTDEDAAKIANENFIIKDNE